MGAVDYSALDCPTADRDPDWNGQPPPWRGQEAGRSLREGKGLVAAFWTASA